MFKRWHNRRADFRLLTLIVAMALVGAAGTASAGDGARPLHGAADADPSPAAKLAQTYDMSWWSVDAGGGSSSGGAFAVTGSIGQPDAGVASGCATALAGGIWAGAEPCDAPLFCNGFESGDTGGWSSVTP